MVNIKITSAAATAVGGGGGGTDGRMTQSAARMQKEIDVFPEE